MRWLVSLLALTILSSCSEGDGKPARKPGYAGKSGEVLLIMDANMVGTDLNQVMEDAFSIPIARIPQREARTTVRTVAKEDMADYNKLHRNLVLVELGRQSKKVSVSRDVWSNGQIVLRLLAPDRSTAVEVVRKNAEQMLALIEQEERLRTKVRLGAHRNQALEQRIYNEHGVRFTIPEEYRLVGFNKHFAWVEVDRLKYKGGREHHALQGLILYHYPFTNDSMLQTAALHAKRDSVLKQFVPGPSKGSFMATEYKFRDIDLSPLVWETEHQGGYAIFQQGLWKMKQDFMGGPFVSMTQVDTITGRIVTLEGYVYSPEFPKREMLREMDALVHTLELYPAAEEK